MKEKIEVFNQSGKMILHLLIKVVSQFASSAKHCSQITELAIWSTTMKQKQIMNSLHHGILRKMNKEQASLLC